MTALYTATGNPGQHAAGSSAAIRAEFKLIETAFSLFPGLTGNATKLLRVNVSETAFEVATSIDGVPIGSSNPSSGAFSTVLANVSVGIGVPSAAVRFHVKGLGPEVARLETEAPRGQGADYISFYDPSGRKGRFGYVGAADDNLTLINDLTAHLLFGTAAAERMRISSSGQVGINTTAFGVASNTSGVSFEPYAGGITQIIGHNGGAASGDPYITFGRSGVQMGKLYQYSSSGVGLESAGDLHLGAGGAERVTVNGTTGVVGIGNTSPGATLDVLATTATSKFQSATAANWVLHQLTNGGGSGYFGLDTSAGAAFGQVYSLGMWHQGNYSLVFGTNNVARAYIAAAGGANFLYTVDVTGAFSAGGGALIYGPYATGVPGQGAVRIGRLGSGEPAVYWGNPSASANNRIWEAFGGATQWQLRAVDDAYAGVATPISITRSGASITQIQLSATAIVDSASKELGYKGLPSASVSTGAFAATDKGKCVYATAGVTVPNSTMAAEDAVVIQNITGSPITITNNLTTAYNTNTGSTLGATFTLGARGRMSIVFQSSTVGYVSGNIS